MAALATFSLIAIPVASAATPHKTVHHHKRHHHRRKRHAHVSRAHHAHPLTQTKAVAATANASAAAAPAAAPAPAPVAAPCVDTTTAAGAAPDPVLDAAVVCLVNQERTSRGLPPLTASAQLDTSAQSWTDWMVSNNQFTHGTDFAGRISAVGYDWQTAGENIATGFATPQDVVTAWMASPDHCRNILDPAFRDVGTGVSAGSVGRFSPGTWTQDFGLRMDARALSHNRGPMNGCPY